MPTDTENTTPDGSNGAADTTSPKPARRAGRPKGSKNKAVTATKAKTRKRKPPKPVYKLADGTTLPPPDQLPAAYLFECAAYAHELKSRLPDF